MGGTGLEELGIIDDGDETTAVGGHEQGLEPDTLIETDPAPADGTDAELPEGLEAHLRSISLFDGLLPVHIRRIAALAQEVKFARNASVFQHGDQGDGLYLILAGSVRISRSVSGVGEEALAVLKPGMYFGEMSIVDDDSPRSADAIAHEETVLLKLPKDDLRDLMFVDRELAYELLWRFVRTLSGRLRESNDRLLMLTVSSKF